MKLRPEQKPPAFLAPLVYNPILDTDSYKSTHWLAYRRGTTIVYSYIEPRGGRYPVVMWAGLQPLLYGKLAQPITEAMVEEARAFWPAHGFPRWNSAGWEKIRTVHGGRLPLKIRAIPEGMVVPVKQALFSVENLDPDLYWLTSYFETMILRDIWTACSIATRIFLMSVRIDKQFQAYSDNPMSPFALLDFSSRGTMGYDHSCIGGTSYLFSFMGSDNVPAVRHANYYYFDEMAGFSVNATEHSIACGFGRDNDDDYIDNALDNMVQPGDILSLVGDTWNIFEFTRKLVAKKDKIAKKQIKIVTRPDSGDIASVFEEVLRIMAEGLGTQTNGKAREVINMEAKALQGDGMNEVTHMLPFEVAEKLRIAPDSALTAAGGGLMTADLDRDTMKWAMKSTEQIIDGVRTDIMKDPITDPGKRSKTGRFALVPDELAGPLGARTVARHDDAANPDDLMVDRLVMGEVVNATTLTDVRERARQARVEYEDAA